jgi:fibronectin type 3 domain-containing protein
MKLFWLLALPLTSWAAPCGESLRSNEVSIIAAYRDVDLTWKASTTRDVISYNVYRRLGAGAFVRIARNIAATSFTDTTAVIGDTYTYYVTADAPACTAAVVQRPAAPGNLMQLVSCL